MLAGSDDLLFARRTILESRKQGSYISLYVEGVFTRRLLTTAPTRVSEWVDVGCLIDSGYALLVMRSSEERTYIEIETNTADIIIGASFSTDDLTNGLDQVVIKCSACKDRLRK